MLNDFGGSSATLGHPSRNRPPSSGQGRFQRRSSSVLTFIVTLTVIAPSPSASGSRFPTTGRGMLASGGKRDGMMVRAKPVESISRPSSCSKPIVTGPRTFEGQRSALRRPRKSNMMMSLRRGWTGLRCPLTRCQPTTQAGRFATSDRPCLPVNTDPGPTDLTVQPSTRRKEMLRPDRFPTIRPPASAAGRAGGRPRRRRPR